MKELGTVFTQVESKAEEDDITMDPVERAEKNSRKKAERVMNNHPDSLIIGSDTVVSIDNRILGKPVDREDAIRMLRDLSGKCNIVYTGITILDTKSGKQLTKHACTKVWFKRVTDEQIEEYVSTREPLDKAGAYGIQGLGGELVERIEGSYSNVVGLPLELLTEMFSSFGLHIDMKKHIRGLLIHI